MLYLAAAKNSNMVKIACFVLGKPDLVHIRRYFRKDWLSEMLGCVAGVTDPEVSKQH